MAIEKMKFISACTDPEHRDAMLLAGMNTGLVQPVIATKIINDDNNGSVISTEIHIRIMYRHLRVLRMQLDVI